MTCRAVIILLKPRLGRCNPRRIDPSAGHSTEKKYTVARASATVQIGIPPRHPLLQARKAQNKTKQNKASISDFYRRSRVRGGLEPDPAGGVDGGFLLAGGDENLLRGRGAARARGVVHEPRQSVLCKLQGPQHGRGGGRGDYSFLTSPSRKTIDSARARARGGSYTNACDSR